MMPPKKRKSSKKPPKEKTPVLIDGLNVGEMTREQLLEHTANLREELDSVRKERNYFQLERDRVKSLCDVAARHLEESNTELKNVDKEVEEDERKQQEEIKVYKQKMKHILCEHQNTITELQADAKVSSEAMQRDHQQLETELQEEMTNIKVSMEKLDISNLMKELELKHQEKMSENREHWEKQLQDAETMYEKKLEDLQQELEKTRKKEINEREEFFKNHNMNLANDHNKALNNSKELIEAAWVTDGECKAKEENSEKTQKKILETEVEFLCLVQEGKTICEPLSKVNEEVESMRKKLIYSKVSQIDSGRVKQKELHELKNKHEALKQKFSEIQKETEELKETFTQKIQELEHRGIWKAEQQEWKIKAMTDHQEEIQAQLNPVLFEPSMDQTALRRVAEEIGKHKRRFNNQQAKLRKYMTTRFKTLRT
ncbi:dynein regulatory complex subunit 4-like [Cheilinus undulatus]|uniref:dynein regulatory complex subunit 4-like n=1 Tax=Cheilinus undulatus TaxID=241271 RepID=UPI001BD5B793|nr:dynein regulatory complex subunit 4-like [Cheilinus undulatus]